MLHESAMAPARLTRPYVGRSPVAPVRVDGDTMEPSVSLPMLNPTRPATVAAAARSGAVVANYLRVANLETGTISRVTLWGQEDTLVVRCRAVVNATGP